MEGCRNPLKAETNSNRTKKSDSGRASLKAYWDDKDGRYDPILLSKLAKAAVCISPDVYLIVQDWANRNGIRIYCAPIEAEWQLVSLENQGVIDGILSVDSDCLCLGARRVITEFATNVENSTDKEVDVKCTIWTQEEVLLGFKKMLGCRKDPTIADFRAFCVFAGCDYLKRTASLSTLTNAFSQWVGAPFNKQELIRDRLITNTALNEPLLRDLNDEELVVRDKFFYAYNQFAFPCVFQIIGYDNKQKTAVAFAAGSYTVALMSFSVDSARFVEVDNEVGYEPRAVFYEHLEADVDLLEVFRITRWCRKGVPLSTFRRLLPVVNGVDVPHGSFVDFNACPIHKLDETTLLIHLEYRGLRFKGKAAKEHGALVRYTEYVMSKNAHPILPKSCHVAGAGHYIAVDVVRADQRPTWIKDLNVIRDVIVDDLPVLNEAWFLTHFGIRNGVRERGYLWLMCGHILPDSMKVDTSALMYDGEACIVLQITCVASQRAADYKLRLVFRKTTRTFVEAPGSHCDCAAGNLFCGHMVAFFLLLCCIQTHCGGAVKSKRLLSLSVFLARLPESVRNIQNMAIPFQYVYNNKGNVGGSNGNMSRAFWSPPGSSELEITAADETNALEMLEAQELMEKHKDEKPLNVIQRAEDALREPVVLELSTANKKKKDLRAIAIEKINEYNRNYIRYMDPGSITAEKKEQLLVHQRLHEKYKSGKLKKCMFSHYVKFMEPLRLQMLEAIDNNDMVFFEKIPTGLSKCPPGWVILADRGFAFDASRYPNLNRQVTPHFINKRDQFTKEELSTDLSVCKLRYNSETHFARVTDTSSLLDVVPFAYFPILQDILDWAEGKSNLCQPFYKPHNY